jgi:hypothetical protein
MTQTKPFLDWHRDFPGPHDMVRQTHYYTHATRSSVYPTKGALTIAQANLTVKRLGRDWWEGRVHIPEPPRDYPLDLLVHMWPDRVERFERARDAKVWCEITARAYLRIREENMETMLAAHAKMIADAIDARDDFAAVRDSILTPL